MRVPWIGRTASMTPAHDPGPLCALPLLVLPPVHGIDLLCGIMASKTRAPASSRLLTRVLLGSAAASPMVEDGDLRHKVVKVGVLVAHVREVLAADLDTAQDVNFTDAERNVRMSCM